MKQNWRWWWRSWYAQSQSRDSKAESNMVSRVTGMLGVLGMPETLGLIPSTHKRPIRNPQQSPALKSKEAHCFRGASFSTTFPWTFSKVQNVSYSHSLLNSFYAPNKLEKGVHVERNVMPSSNLCILISSFILSQDWTNSDPLLSKQLHDCSKAE